MPKYMGTGRGSTGERWRALQASSQKASGNFSHATTNIHNSNFEFEVTSDEDRVRSRANLKRNSRVNGSKNSTKPERTLVISTVDDYFQTEGFNAYTKFEEKVENLDKQLYLFSNAAHKIGGSINILSSILGFRKKLNRLLDLFRRNAGYLFSRVANRLKLSQSSRKNKTGYSRSHSNPLQNPKDSEVANSEGDLDLEHLPQQFERLAEEVSNLLNSLREFPDFRNNSMDDTSIVIFGDDLKYWADCLKEHKGNFNKKEVQRYLHDLTTQPGGLGEQIDIITKTISHFVETGMPSIHLSQQRGATNLQNLSTVATFFSAVTATTIQFSYNNTESFSARAVNAFWFASLVFSIASVVNSLLGLTWKYAVYRSTPYKTPWWVLIWIEYSPLGFLVIAIASFSAGLVLFTYTSKQGFLTCIITVVFTSFSSFGLVGISAWFASESWTHSKRWRQKFANASSERISRWALAQWFVKTYNNTMSGSKRQFTALKSTLDRGIEWLSGTSQRQGTELVEHSGNSNSNPLSTNPLPTPSNSSPRISTLTGVMMAFLRMKRLATTQGTNSRPTVEETGSSSEPKGTNTPGSCITVTSAWLENAGIKRSWSSSEAPIKHLQFSPDGKYLAMLRQDNIGVIFQVGDSDSSSGWPDTGRRLEGPIEQVAWSPDGKRLLTKYERSISVFTEEGFKKVELFDRMCSRIQSVTWMPGGEAFLSVEYHESDRSEVVKLDLTGKEHVTYTFERIALRNVAITPALHLIVGVGVLIKSTEGHCPEKPKREKRIIVFDIDENKITSHVPLFNNARDITMECNSPSEHIALISYKDNSAPQLWKLGLVKNANGVQKNEPRLSLEHTYIPKIPAVDFAGPSHFGRKDNQLVLGATKNGDIYLWHREQGTLLRHILPQSSGGDNIACISCNRANEGPLMFATGSDNGSIRVWTVSEKNRASSRDPSTSSYQDDNDANSGLHPPVILPNSPFLLSPQPTSHQRQAEPSISIMQGPENLPPMHKDFEMGSSTQEKALEVEVPNSSAMLKR